MPRQYDKGGRATAGSFRRPPEGAAPPGARSLRERVGALKNLRPFMAMVWRASPGLTAASLVLRLIRALLPVATLFVGKLIIDDVVVLVQTPGKPETLRAWWDSGLLNWLGLLLLAEFALAVRGRYFGPCRLAHRQPAFGTGDQFLKHPPDGARGNAGPGRF